MANDEIKLFSSNLAPPAAGTFSNKLEVVTPENFQERFERSKKALVEHLKHRHEIEPTRPAIVPLWVAELLEKERPHG